MFRKKTSGCLKRRIDVTRGLGSNRRSTAIQNDGRMPNRRRLTGTLSLFVWLVAGGWC
jgi:hypothetical protein